MVTTGTPKITTGRIFLVVFLVVLGLYLFGSFTKIEAGVLEFELPDVDKTTMMAFKIILIGIATFATFMLVTKATVGTLTQKDLVIMIVIGVAIYFLWDKVLVQIFNASSIDEITFSVVKKIGIIP